MCWHDIIAPGDSCARADGDAFWEMSLREGELGDLMGVGVEGAALQLAVVVVDIHVAHLRAIGYRDLFTRDGGWRCRTTSRFPNEVVIGIRGGGVQAYGRIGASYGGVIGIHLCHGGCGRRVLDGEDERCLVAIVAVFGRDAVSACIGDDTGGKLVRRRGRGIDELVVGEVVNVPSEEVIVFVVGGQRDGVGQADLLIAKYFEAGLDDDGEGVGAELATRQEVALVFDGDAEGVGCVEQTCDFIGTVKILC